MVFSFYLQMVPSSYRALKSELIRDTYYIFRNTCINDGDLLPDLLEETCTMFYFLTKKQFALVRI